MTKGFQPISVYLRCGALIVKLKFFNELLASLKAMNEVFLLLLGMTDARITGELLISFRYTLFYEHTLTGKPVMRPLWAEFPDDENVYDEEREWLVGAGLLVRPVMEPDVTSISLYLPGRRNVVWYEWATNKVY